MKRVLLSTASLLTAACGWIPGEGFFSDPNADGVTADELPEASNFECADAEGEPLFCADFNDGQTEGFSYEGGEWEVVDERLIGYGPNAPTGDCTESLMTHAVLTDVRAQDVHMKVQLTAMERVDKVILLRNEDSANRLQLNFRALTRDGDYGDLMVQETRGCVFTVLTELGEVPIGHDMGEPIDAEIFLTGQRLVVLVNGETVLDRSFPIAEVTGAVGIGVIDHATSVFDDLVIYAE